MVTTYEDIKEKAMDTAEEVKDDLQSGHKHHEEDRLTTAIEDVTKKIPSGAFLGFALCSIGASAFFAATGRTRVANFIGLWAPTILIMGMYNKLVKEHEHDFGD
jgi:hypothetical protein